MTICCAASDEAAVREAAEALEARGHQVGLAVGVDGDHEILTRAIAAQQGRGLFVLCRSHALDRNAVDELREILRTHDVPFGRTLTLAVDTQRPREVEERIVSVLRRMVTGRADGRPRSWGSAVPQQDEDPDTTIRRPGAAPVAADPSTVLVGLGTEPEDADPYASTSQIEMAARARASAPYVGADHTAVGPAPRAPAVGPALPPMPSAVPMEVPIAPTVPLSVPIASASPSPMPMASPMPTAPPSPMPSPPAAIEPLGPGPLSVEPDSAPKLTPSMSEAMAGYTPPPVSRVAEESPDEFETPLTVGGRMGRALGSPAGLAVVLGGVAVVLLVVLAISLLGDGEGDADDAQASSAPPTASADESVDAEAKAGGRPAAAKVDAEPEPANAEPEPANAEPAEAEGELADAEPEPDATRPPAAAADPGDAPPKPPARPSGPIEDPPEVVEALEAREVRALDIFLVAPERKGSLTYEQAVDYCSTLEVAGLDGWRVPAIGELNAVASAKMLGSSVYWSATPGDTFGDRMLVLNGKKGTISVVLKGWDGAKIVCVRLRQP